MKKDREINCPPLAHTRTTTATTYTLRPVDDRRGYWAHCTVNDVTGELQITSDFGNWAHSWYIPHTGKSSLTEFIATRDRDHCNYLADKLTSGEARKGAREFDAERTAHEFKRHAAEAYKDGRLSIGQLRNMCDDLAQIADATDEREFVDRFFHIDDHWKIHEEPWECLKYNPAHSYLVLMHRILPALVSACAKVIADRSPETATA
jgi:hypothetical protein